MKLTRESVFTFLNAHLLVVVVLAVANIVLLTRLVLAWHTLHDDRPEQIQEYQANLKTIELQTAPLRGLPAKVEASEKQAVAFYEHRMPSNYSTISAELVRLADANHVKQSHLTYTQTPALQGLAQVGLDASLSGEYAPIMRFINGLERDKVFFVINGLTLTGQQGGIVNVRLHLTTYLHAADAGSMTPPAESGTLPDDGKPGADAASAESGAGGQ